MKALLSISFLAGLMMLTSCKDQSNTLYTPQFTPWEITNSSSDNISWSKFKWVNGNLGSKFYERIALNVPCRIDGVQWPVAFQLDLGADVTGVDELTFKSFYPANPGLQSKIKSAGSNKYYDNLTLEFDSFTATKKSSYVYQNIGGVQSLSTGDTIRIGTIGADIFQSTVLIIDYPNERFAYCKTLPADLASNLIDITLDQQGRVILPMQYGGKSLRILFDTGSSIFPILTDPDKISWFSTSPDVEVLEVPSWGKTYTFTGKAMAGSFVLAGQTFSNVNAYSSTRNLGTGINYDGITGNVLFWNRTIAIDFMNKKFGIK